MNQKNAVKGLLAGARAGMAGVSTDTLRHYERKGLLHAARSANGYRVYGPDAIDRVRLVQHALSVGFTLGELASFLRIRDSGGAPCQQVRGLAAKKLQELEDRMRDLRRLRAELRALLADWDVRLAAAGNGGKAWLLETLAVDTQPRHRRRDDFGGKK